MPCNSDYMEATAIEIAFSRVLCLLAELDGKKWTQSQWDGYHSSVYNKVCTIEKLDTKTAELCAALRKEQAIAQYSLELQTWWRDHQATDAARKRQAEDYKKDQSLRAKALKKLTAAERKLLGLK